jgi:hypothetical protein
VSQATQHQVVELLITPPLPHQEESHIKPTQLSTPQVELQLHTSLEPPPMVDKLLQLQFHQVSHHTFHPPSPFQTAKVETTTTHMSRPHLDMKLSPMKPSQPDQEPLHT